eukprot:COSAG05_NODE_4838_length_1354_cov_1.392032_2_plen_136_part_00
MLGLETRRHLPILVAALGMAEAQSSFILGAFADRAQWRQESVRREVITLLDTAFGGRTADEWVARFNSEGVWHHKIMSVDEVTQAPQPNAAVTPSPLTSRCQEAPPPPPFLLTQPQPAASGITIVRVARGLCCYT